MAADDSKDEILLAVPSDVSNLKDAIEEGRARCQESGIKTMRITLGIDHAEPKEAWPLELTLQRGQGCPQQLEIPAVWQCQTGRCAAGREISIGSALVQCDVWKRWFGWRWMHAGELPGSQH